MSKVEIFEKKELIDQLSEIINERNRLRTKVFELNRKLGASQLEASHYKSIVSNRQTEDNPMPKRQVGDLIRYLDDDGDEREVVLVSPDDIYGLYLEIWRQETNHTETFKGFNRIWKK